MHNTTNNDNAKKNRLIIGAQPNNNIHLGNYFGAIFPIMNIEKVQKNLELFIFSADLHAFTTTEKVERKNIFNFIKTMLCFLSNNHVFYIQSDFLQIPYLSWLLSPHTTVGDLMRMTQFKSKSEKFNENCGLLTYPVLMAADILGIKADFVGAGIDQEQHVELARRIGDHFNKTYNKEIFPMPYLFETCGLKIKDLQDSTAKMSKSAENQDGVLYLLDDEKTITQKIAKAKTDSLMMPVNIESIKESRLEIYNLCEIYRGITDISFETMQQKFGNGYLSAFKKDLAEKLIIFNSNFKKNFNSISDQEVENLLIKNRNYVNSILNKTLLEVNSLLFV